MVDLRCDTLSRASGDKCSCACWHCQSSAILSDSGEHLEEGGNCMHAVEKVQRDGKIENCAPYAETVCLLFQSVVILWPAAKGRKNPQLKWKKERALIRYT